MKEHSSRELGSDRELAPLAAARVGVEPVPATVVIVPWGEVESTNGGFTVDEESVRLAVEAFERHGCDLPIDYEHQTLGGAYTSPSGQAPAAGWIKRLRAEPGRGIEAEVHWTEPAVKQLAAKQYRYLSPVAIVRKHDRKLVALHSVALTNKPAIVGMQAITNRQEQPTGDEEDVRRELCRALSLDEGCSDHEVLAAASHRLAALESQGRLRRANDRVAEAVAQGKLTPAQRSWAVNLCLKDEALFDEWLGTAAVVVQPGRLEAPTPGGALPSEAALVASARAEYRAHPELAALTSEEAYVACMVKERGQRQWNDATDQWLIANS